jgi:hypothetical protein
MAIKGVLSPSTSQVPAYACYMAGLDYREGDVTRRLAEPALHRRYDCFGCIGNHAILLSGGRDLLRTSRDQTKALCELTVRLNRGEVAVGGGGVAKCGMTKSYSRRVIANKEL